MTNMSGAKFEVGRFDTANQARDLLAMYLNNVLEWSRRMQVQVKPWHVNQSEVHAINELYLSQRRRVKARLFGIFQWIEAFVPSRNSRVDDHALGRAPDSTRWFGLYGDDSVAECAQEILEDREREMVGDCEYVFSLWPDEDGPFGCRVAISKNGEITGRAFVLITGDQDVDRKNVGMLTDALRCWNVNFETLDLHSLD